MGTKQVKITPEQKKELKALCIALKSAEDAKRIRLRLKSFIEDNEEVLRKGLRVDDLVITVKVSKTLLVADAD